MRNLATLLPILLITSCGPSSNPHPPDQVPQIGPKKKDKEFSHADKLALEVDKYFVGRLNERPVSYTEAEYKQAKDAFRNWRDFIVPALAESPSSHFHQSAHYVRMGDLEAHRAASLGESPLKAMDFYAKAISEMETLIKRKDSADHQRTRAKASIDDIKASITATERYMH